MASAKGRQVLSLYRACLRELPPIIIRPNATHAPGFPDPPEPRTRRLPLHEQLRLQMKSDAPVATVNMGESSGSQRQSNNVAFLRTRQLIRYLEAQRAYVELLERYNTGLCEDNGERIRRAARRVGLDIADSSA